MEDCLFCKIANHQIEADIIDENDNVVVIMALENHPLVITKQHYKDIYELTEEVGSEVMKEAIRISKAVKKALNCDGINLVQSNESDAGQEVFHFHLHIKPRWKDDKVNLHWDTEPVDKQIREETSNKIRSLI